LPFTAISAPSYTAVVSTFACSANDVYAHLTALDHATDDDNQ